jgi:hypothetical protein
VGLSEEVDLNKLWFIEHIIVGQVVMSLGENKRAFGNLQVGKGGLPPLKIEWHSFSN